MNSCLPVIYERQQRNSRACNCRPQLMIYRKDVKGPRGGRGCRQGGGGDEDLNNNNNNNYTA